MTAPQPGAPPQINAKQAAGEATTTTTMTAWDSSLDSSASSGDSSGSLKSSSSGSSDLDAGSSDSDMSGSTESSGSAKSGSSGFNARIWQWFLLLLLCCCCIGGAGGGAFMMANKKKSKKRGVVHKEAPSMPMELPMDPQQPQTMPEVPVQTFDQVPQAPIQTMAPQQFQQVEPLLEAPLFNGIAPLVPLATTSTAIPSYSQAYTSYAAPVTASYGSYAAPQTMTYAAPATYAGGSYMMQGATQGAYAGVPTYTTMPPISGTSSYAVAGQPVYAQPPVYAQAPVITPEYAQAPVITPE